MINKLTSWDNLKLKVVDQDLCIGCGICVGVCPVNVLTIEFNILGEYRPSMVGDCIDCGVCDNSCPFIESVNNEDELAESRFSTIEGISYHDYTGYYLNTFVGYAPEIEQRLNGASGGVLSWLLSELLERGIVDKVISVENNSNPNKLFKYSVFSSSKEILANAKTAYYPVELSEVIKYIKENEYSYVVVGVPCFIKGLELAKERNHHIRNRVKYLFGLVCGKNKSTLYTKHLIEKMGFSSKNVKQVIYRDKRGTDRANNFKFTLIDNKGLQNSYVWADGVKDYWTTPIFDQKPCWFCDDIFAEVADVAFMDAWLDEFIPDNKGTSLVLSRNKEISNLLNQFLTSISIESIIRSQQAVILKKRVHISRKQKWINRRTVMRTKKEIADTSGLIVRLLNKRKTALAWKYFKKQRFNLGKDLHSVERIDRDLKKYQKAFSKLSKIEFVLKNKCYVVSKVLKETGCKVCYQRERG